MILEREKALKVWHDSVGFNEVECSYELQEAISTAFRELEKEPCEDCISRQATVERLCKIAEFMNEKRDGLGSPYVMAALFIQDNKDEFPPVIPQPKMGKWAILKDEYGDVVEAVCSCCDKNGNHKWAFCPNCGAKMAELQESEGEE